ncbi:hypothetical protein BDN71DRAFT_598201 [Pleurotus eryngii]|uniref:Uncharacterized protein n=1 Tax=Pleurotus eryngii TaxID=5323 RepID=A0A9P5ZJH8_PLEER|nr:hypothetical protein BDN71DRAFT_598201 [Pleurotus eryngii]
MGFNYPTMSADIMIEHGFVYQCLEFARRVKRARCGYILWILMHALLPIIAARVSALSTGETSSNNAYPIPLYCRPLRPSSTGYSAIPLVSRSFTSISRATADGHAALVSLSSGVRTGRSMVGNDGTTCTVPVGSFCCDCDGRTATPRNIKSLASLLSPPFKLRPRHRRSRTDVNITEFAAKGPGIPSTW